MGLFTPKKHKIIESYNTTEVDGAEVWMVSWYARYGEYSSSCTKVAKAFLNEQEANQFANSLRAAQKLLQYTENICIKVEKQQ